MNMFKLHKKNQFIENFLVMCLTENRTFGISKIKLFRYLLCEIVIPVAVVVSEVRRHSENRQR